MDKKMTQTLQDRRIKKDKQRLKYYVWAKDSFMTKWGNDCGALDNAISYAVWFVEDKNRADQMFKWLETRDEMSHIRIGASDDFMDNVASLNETRVGYHISTYPTYSHRSFKD